MEQNPPNTDENSTPEEGKGFGRPWEAEEAQDEAEAEAEVFSLPGLAEEESEDAPEEDDVEDDASATEQSGDDASTDDDGDPEKIDLTDWETMAEGPSKVDEYTSEAYSIATTQEYQGLAEEVSKAAEEEWELQAVAATLPGVGSGLVGFEDVTGEEAVPEEHHEAVEQAASSDLTMRVASALVIFGMFLGTLLLGGWWFSAFVILVMVVGTGEFYATVRSAGYRPLALFGLLGVIFMGVGAHTVGASSIGAWAAFFTAATVLFFSLSPRRLPLENSSVTVTGMAWVGMLSFAILIAGAEDPVAFILFVVFVVVFNDMGAYFVGKSIGRRKLAPILSPNKTIEGFIGGLIAAAVVASILVTFPAWEEIGLVNGLIAAAVVGFVAPLGDAAESMVKRALSVKDMGSVLPGHGGILDRIDGFLFAVPALYFLFLGLGLL